MRVIRQPEHRDERGHLDRKAVDQELPRAAPIKRAPWEWYLPIYFWAGGVAAGGWLAATAESWGGEGDREVVRAGRYLAFVGVMTGTGLLILDLGRPERFLNMLRVVHPRSAMSLGSWGLVSLGVPAGGAALLQLLEDLSSGQSRTARISAGLPGRVLQLIGLPPALFVGTYTGVLLASTSTPIWAERRFLLPLLFLASGMANGLAATMGIVELRKRAPVPARRRLAAASTVALATDLTLSLISERAVAGMPSERKVSPAKKIVQTLTLLAGTALPLVLTTLHTRDLDRAPVRDRLHLRKRSRPSILPVIASATALVGGLALRFRVTHQGYRSAATPEDTWVHTRNRRHRDIGRMTPSEPLMRSERRRELTRVERYQPHPPHREEPHLTEGRL